jgi:DNA-binding transcriptional ArsR family regulator
MIKADLIPVVARRFKALGEPARLALVAALQGGERSVSELVEVTGRGQPNVSQHLAALVNVGLVESRREGTHVYYSVADPMVLEICNTVCRSVETLAPAVVRRNPSVRTTRRQGVGRG